MPGQTKLWGLGSQSGKGGGGIFGLNTDGSDFESYVFPFFGGANPRGDLLQGTNGNPSGGSSNNGVLFEFDPSGGGVYSVLHEFVNATGRLPYGSLIEVDGKFYGMTSSGGSSDAGVLFEYDTSGSGAYSVLYEFDSATGAYPLGSLIEVGGKFYGMTSSGGSSDGGVVFEYDPSGNVYTVLRNLGGLDSDIKSPYGSLLAIAPCTPPVFTACPPAPVTANATAPCTVPVSYTVTAGGTPAPALTYAFSGATTSSGSGSGSGEIFNPGSTLVTVTAANDCGSETCTFTVTVDCSLEFSGTIRWDVDFVTGIKDAAVNLTGAATGSEMTDMNGDYQFTIPYATGNFTIKPVKNINKLNGVTVGDATAIQQHVTLINPITDPYKLVCADVNKSNSVSTLDAVLITQCLLGNPLANAIFNTSWRFVPTSHTMENPPWGFPEQISLTGVSTNQSGLDFYGVKIGDIVAPYANPANFGAGTPLVWRVTDQVLQVGETVDVEFRADQLNDLNSFQFALRFDPEQLALEAIEPLDGLPNVSVANFGTYNLAEGEIRMVWAQAKGQFVEEATPVFRLKFTVLDSGRKLSEVLHLENSILPGYSYNSDFAESGVQLNYVETTATDQPHPGAGLILLQNQPNPFSQSTRIGFVLPAGAEAQLRIYDVSGKLIQQISKQYPAGYNEEEIQLNGLTGALSYKLITPFGTRTKRMVRVGN